MVFYVENACLFPPSIVKCNKISANYVLLASTHHTVVQLDYQAMEWRKQHFLTSLMVISSATLSFSLPLFLSASLPQREMIYSSLFQWFNNVC